MRMLSAGDRAVSDIPMRLMIAAVLTSLAVPVFWGAYNDLSERMTTTSIEREISGLLSDIDEVMSGGAGSSREVDLSIVSWGSSNVEKVIIGGRVNASGSSMYKVQYSISGAGTSFMTLDPPVIMTSSENGSLELYEGSHRLRITNTELESGFAAVIEVL